MRDLVRRYLEGGLSRRRFVQNSGVTEGTGGELVLSQAKAAEVQYLFSNPGWFERPSTTPSSTTPASNSSPVCTRAWSSRWPTVIKVSGKPGFVNIHVIAGTAQAARQLYNASRDGSLWFVKVSRRDGQSAVVWRRSMRRWTDR